MKILKKLLKILQVATSLMVSKFLNIHSFSILCEHLKLNKKNVHTKVYKYNVKHVIHCINVKVVKKGLEGSFRLKHVIQTFKF